MVFETWLLVGFCYVVLVSFSGRYLELSDGGLLFHAMFFLFQLY